MFKGRPLKSYYCADSKTWSGEKFTKFYGNECSIGRILFEELRKRPKKICQISETDQTQLTNEEVLLQAIRIAKYFQKLGLQQSDIIGIACRNTTYLMGVILACFFSGIAYHSLSPYLDEETFRQLFGLTKPRIIFCDAQDYETIKSGTSDLNILQIITMKQRVTGVLLVTDLLQTVDGDEEFTPAVLENGIDQTLTILCSSGTTGFPKAVTISNTTRMYEISSQLTDEDILYTSSTMDWLSAPIFLMAAVIYGAKRIISDQPFSPEHFLEIAEKYRITMTLLGPTHLARLIKSPNISANKIHSIKYFYYGGDKCSIQTQIKLNSFLPNGMLLFCYGMTEISAILTKNENYENKPNSVGCLLPGYKLKVIDDKGQNLGIGAIGELCLYNGEKWLGYYNNSKNTAEIYDENGWIHSGDLGYMDQDGYLFIVDRKKDLLRFHETDCWPSEIEEVIAELPDVVDVCVFGVWNDVDGDAAAAAVVRSIGSTLSEQEIVKYVASRIPLHYKQLKAGAIFLKEFPKTNNGKLDRKALLPIYLQMKNKL